MKLSNKFISNKKKRRKLRSIICIAALVMSCGSLSFTANAEPLQSEKETSGNEISFVEAEVKSDDSTTETETEVDENKTPSFDPFDNGGNYSTVLYNSTNGLPTTDVNAIAQTNDGFIWIGCDSGLVRYDGNKFEYMWHDIGVINIECLYRDSKDRLWIGTSDNGIAVIENNIIRFMDEELSYDAVRSIAEDGNGNIYLVFNNYIIMIDNEMERHKLEDEPKNLLYFSGAVSGSDGLVYVLSSNNDIFSINNGNIIDFANHETTNLTGVSCILPDHDNPGHIYVCKDEILVSSIDMKNYSSLKLTALSYYSINNLSYFNGKIMVCAGNHAGFIDDTKIVSFGHLPINFSIDNVMQDYEGNLWFTSKHQGIMKFVPNQFTDIYKKYDIENDTVNAVCVYEGKLFVGTDTGLTVIDNNGLCSSVPVKKIITSDIVFEDQDLIKENQNDLLHIVRNFSVSSMICDSRNRLWLTLLNSAVLCYENEVLTIYDDNNEFVSKNFIGISEKKDGSILVFMSDGFNIISDGEVLSDYKSHRFPDGHIVCAAEGENEDIILGTGYDDLYIADKNSGVLHIGKNDGLLSRKILRIKHDHKRDIYWIVTGNSIAYMTSGYKIKNVTSFPYNNNYDIFQNSKDEMWILNSMGIVVVPTDDMLADNVKDPICYGTEDGLPYIPSANTYSQLTENGDLYIAGNNGVARVNIETFAENDVPLKVSVPYLEADGIKIYPDKNGDFNIASNVKKLTVYGYVMNYSLTKAFVSYRLDGFENSYTTVERHEFDTVDYTNLPGGKYSFIMDVTDLLGKKHITLNVKIIKEKSIYEEIWFHIFVVLAGILMITAIVVLIMYFRTRKLRKRSRDSMMLIHEISEAFAKVIDMKDTYTNGHSTRVAKYTAMLAEELGYDKETTKKFYHIALLHDIGKVGVPSEVLNKPGKLTDTEFEIIKSHTIMGYGILEGISIIPDLALGAKYHHERPDGKGYPNHLTGDEIPRVAQIIAVADCFDAMYSNRPYRKRMNFEKAVSIIKEASGTQLTSDVVDAFLRLVDRGEFRAPDDEGGGTTENIENIRGS